MTNRYPLISWSRTEIINTRFTTRDYANVCNRR
jgi:hypothetical protein